MTLSDKIEFLNKRNKPIKALDLNSVRAFIKALRSALYLVNTSNHEDLFINDMNARLDRKIKELAGKELI